MSISELSVRRPVLVTMVFVLICAIACIYIPKLETALYPSVDMPMLSVMVDCNDAGPEEIELQVAKVLENQLGSIEGLESMTTTSSSGRCMIMLEFSYKTDLDEAKDTVNTKLTSITRQLPSWAETPSLMMFDQSSNSSIMSLVITGPYSQEDLTTIAEDTAANLLLRVDGVAEVSVNGRDSTEYKVIVDPVLLPGVNLTMSQVANALSSRNTQGTAGSMESGTLSYSITLDERYRTLDEIRDTVITTVNGVDIKVSDVAEVSTDNDSMSFSYINGEPVVMLRITNESDVNEATVAKAVKGSLETINSQLPTGVELSVERDETAMISSTLNEVYKSAIEGVLLAALVIFIFLRGFKTTFIIALSMPISILITLMIMAMADITVNSMSMAGLILGIGMIVDASICILENSYNFREQGYKPAVAAILGSKRMFNAIFASTMTTVCVFLPILIYKSDLGMIGMMFQDLILTVCISLVASLFVAVTIVPALFGSILAVDTRVQKPLKNRFLIWLDRKCIAIEKGMENIYAKVLNWCLDNKFLFILLLVVLLVFSLGFFTNIGMSLTPQMNTDDSINLSLTMPAGTIEDLILSEVFEVEEKIENTLPEGSWTSISASARDGSGSLEISLPDITEQKYSASQLKEMILPLLNSNADATWTFGGGRGPGSSSAIDVQIKSSSTEDAKEAADLISKIIAEYVPEAQNITSDISNGAPQVDIEIDEEIAQDLGVTAKDVLSTVQNALSGITATTLNTFSNTTTYKLYVEFPEDAFDGVQDLGSLLISTKGGNVRLETFVTFNEGTAAKSIQRENKVRVNHVTASAKDGVSASVIQEKVNNALDQYLLLPEGVTISQGGQMQQFTNYAPTLITIIVLALILVYAVMAAQFESLSDPLIIFATIPMLLIGVVFIHLIFNQDFSLYSIVGIVALIGVVVNNGIVLVDAINQEVARKITIREACIKVAKRRLRPILMTTLTTILGMVPMAFFPGDGSEMMQPIALTFVGGMFTGAMMTLLLSPVLYSIINKRKEKNFDNPMSLSNQLAEFDQGLVQV